MACKNAITNEKCPLVMQKLQKLKAMQKLKTENNMNMIDGNH